MSDHTIQTASSAGGVVKAVNDDDDAIVISQTSIDIGNDNVNTNGALQSDGPVVLRSGATSTTIVSTDTDTIHIKPDTSVAYGSSTVRVVGDTVAAAGCVGTDSASLNFKVGDERVNVGTVDSSTLRFRFGGSDDSVAASADSVCVAQLGEHGMRVQDIANDVTAMGAADNTLVHAVSTTRGVLFPRINAPAWQAAYEGHVFYDTSDNKLKYGSNTAWVDMI